MSESNGIHKKRFYAIMISLVVVGGMVYYFNSYLKSAFTNEAAISIQQTNKEVQKISDQVDVNTQKIVNVTANQQVGFANDKVLANGVNNLGSVVGGDIKSIKDKTNLLDDIKFNTEQILNKTTLGNITLADTRFIGVNVSAQVTNSSNLLTNNETMP